MTSELENKIAIVTGASSGIGAATAIKMAEAGAKVVLAARREAESQLIVEQITGAGGEALFVQTDASQEEDIKNLMARTVEVYGRIDCAFNNAGRGDNSLVDWHERDVDIFDTSNALNLRGVWLCMREQLSQMVKQGSGVIINNSSIAGLTAAGGRQEVYSATKHGVIGLTKTAAQKYGPMGIRVNVVCPGPVETPIIAGLPEDRREAFTRRIPVRRFGSPDEVAEPVVFLCSDRASFINGTVITIDGGMVETSMQPV